MQRVTNCILISNHNVLLLKKPRHGWYAIPGGKMEQGETIKEAVVREFWEETALKISRPNLAGVFTFTIEQNKKIVREWMMFTFIAHHYEGQLTAYCEEGELEWVPLDQISKLPMAEGDYTIFDKLLNNTAVVTGSFTYTADDKLLQVRMEEHEGGLA
ncbi:8-oxo-dGTP diphosphatase [Virgibacillus sp. W0181]|uniref:8-oxo-dGTP diphosphatase n=1 Tax=Virgibacillus sp. W0181 TaxID=3391581 RepID=UPI003F44DF06